MSYRSAWEIKLFAALKSKLFAALLLLWEIHSFSMQAFLQIEFFVALHAFSNLISISMAICRETYNVMHGHRYLDEYKGRKIGRHDCRIE